jgi:hypothetical protein
MSAPTPHPIAHFTFSSKTSSSESTMQGLPHYHGVNPCVVTTARNLYLLLTISHSKSYALDGAVPDVYLFLAVPSTQNQSGVVSEVHLRVMYKS